MGTAGRGQTVVTRLKGGRHRPDKKDLVTDGPTVRFGISSKLTWHLYSLWTELQLVRHGYIVRETDPSDGGVFVGNS